MSSGPAIFFENGRKLPDSRGSIGLDSRGFLYGETVFETMLVSRGNVFRLADHLARLAGSAAAIEMAFELSTSELADEIEGSVKEAGLDEASVRLTLVRDQSGSGIRIPKETKTTRYCRIAPLSRDSEGPAKIGLRASRIRSEVLREFPPAKGKFGNYLPRIAALESALKEGADDALLLSWDGFVLGGATSNVFYFRDGVLGTPPLRAGILEGVTRRVVIEIAREVGLEVREEWLSESDLGKVEEMFLTSSLRGLAPLRSVDDLRFESEKRPIFSLLATRYAHRLEAL